MIDFFCHPYISLSYTSVHIFSSQNFFTKAYDCIEQEQVLREDDCRLASKQLGNADRPMMVGKYPLRLKGCSINIVNKRTFFNKAVSEYDIQSNYRYICKKVRIGKLHLVSSLPE